MQSFMPWHGFLGGILIGLSAAFYLLAAGRISGISGIVESALKPTQQGFGRAVAYLAGLAAGAALVAVIAPGLVPKIVIAQPWPLVVTAGLLVGFGSRLGGGCTSGHGVCGLPRLSVRSFVATGVFMTTAALTVFLTRHVI